MNFSFPEFSLGRQRRKKWVPLITQQLRLRHVYQILAFNLQSVGRGSFYFTLHLTTMSSPFYTSEIIESSNPKWSEINVKDVTMAGSSVVIRVWLKCNDSDKVIITWGVNFSGLVYIGNKISDIQPKFFERNTVIFFMHGGYFTSHYYVKTELPKAAPFAKSLNLVDTLNDKVVYRRIAVKDHKNEVQSSYNLEKLRKLHYLQLRIKNKKFDVQVIKEKIQKQTCVDETSRNLSESHSGPSGYSQQLLTMNSLNKMLHEKPTKEQRQEMAKLSREIEIAKFKMKLLTSERDKKYAKIRMLKQKHCNLVDEIEEKSSVLMENYHHLSKESEKLKEYKKSLFQHREMYSHIHTQLGHRRRQLLKDLLFIYPIKKSVDNKYTILDMHLPSSDVLADCTDTGLSVALGYITHVLTMCATILQVPLRYPMTHYGSRSYITDHVSTFLTERGREFPLFTRGKEKMQFTYAVYLLNKNLAQFRWSLGMNTNDLKATLPNLLSFLQGGRAPLQGTLPILSTKFDFSNDDAARLMSLSGLPSLTVNDPVLDYIRKEKNVRSLSPTGRTVRKSQKNCRNEECGKGLSEILAIPEAYLNRQISSDLLRSYVSSDRFTRNPDICCNAESNSINDLPAESNVTLKNGTAQTLDPIEQGTDPLAANVTSNIAKSIKVHSDLHLRIKDDDEYNLKQTRRISRSVGSYTDEDDSFLRASFELGSEPLLNISREGDGSQLDGKQQEFLEKWLENGPNIVSSSENLYPDEFLGSSVEFSSPLMARTDKLLTTKSFNLMRPK